MRRNRKLVLESPAIPGRTVEVARIAPLRWTVAEYQTGRPCLRQQDVKGHAERKAELLAAHWIANPLVTRAMLTSLIAESARRVA